VSGSSQPQPLLSPCLGRVTEIYVAALANVAVLNSEGPGPGPSESVTATSTGQGRLLAEPLDTSTGG